MKKQLFTLLITMGVIIQLQAQSSFSIIKPVVEATIAVTPSDYAVINAGIKNLTSRDVIVVFNLVSVNAPEGWVHSLCGPQNCYTPGSSAKGEDKLKVSEKNQIFEVNWTPKSEGVGEIVYEVYDKTLPDLKQLIKFKLTATMPTNVEEQALASSLKLFPNPCIGMIYVTFQSEIQEPVAITLMDVLGKTMYLNVQQQIGNANIEIPMDSYPLGIYQLSIKNSNNKVISMQKVIKN